MLFNIPATGEKPIAIIVAVIGVIALVAIIAACIFPKISNKNNKKK